MSNMSNIGEISNHEVFFHKIDYYLYNDMFFGIIPSMDLSFTVKKQEQLPTVLISNKKPLFHKSYKRKERIKRVLVLTNSCNLKCSYCYEGENKDKQILDVNDVQNNIEAMFQEAINKQKKLISFSLFGGEPTLNWDSVERAIELSEKLEKKTGIRCYKAIVTNGVMKKEQVKYISKHFDFVYFSFDGPKELFLKQRRPKAGDGIYNIIYNNAKEVYKSGAYLSFKITVTSLTLDYLKEIDDFFADNFPTCGRLYQPCMVDINDSLYISFGDFFKKYLELKRYSIFKRNLTTSLYKNKPSDRFCNLMIRNVVYPDGSVLACHRSNMCIPEDKVKQTFKVGYCKDGRIYKDKDKEKYLKSFIVNNIPKCNECSLKYHCCGGCSTVKLLSGTGEMFRKADYCDDIMKFSYTSILSRLLNKDISYIHYIPQKIKFNKLEINEENFIEIIADKIITIEE